MQEEFDHYRIDYYSGVYKDIIIYCLNSKKNYKYVGMIYFLDYKIDPQIINGIICLFYPLNQFDNIINIIRYNKPLFLVIDPPNKYGYISTATERVGEQEGID